MKELTALVPFRDDAAGIRRRNLTVVLRWLDAAGITTILCEHADVPAAHVQAAPGLRRTHAAAAGRPFNKAAACNAGFGGVTTPLIALVDADTFMSMSGFIECAQAVADDLDVVRPFGRLIELDEPTTEAVVSGLAALPVPAITPDDSRDGEYVPLCGGLVILRATAYERVGGMDESFEGWGGEDDALSAALRRSKLRCGVHQEHPAFHLAHPRSVESRYGHEHYARNRERARWWWEASEQEVEQAMAAGRRQLVAD